MLQYLYYEKLLYKQPINIKFCSRLLIVHLIFFKRINTFNVCSCSNNYFFVHNLNVLQRLLLSKKQNLLDIDIYQTF